MKSHFRFTAQGRDMQVPKPWQLHLSLEPSVMKEMNAMNQSTMNHQEGMKLKHTFGRMFRMFSQPSRCLVHQLQGFLSQVKGFREPGEGLDGLVAQGPGLTVSKKTCEKGGETVKQFRKSI